MLSLNQQFQTVLGQKNDQEFEDVKTKAGQDHAETKTNASSTRHDAK